MAEMGFPLVYYPTTTVLVDDHQGMLDSMRLAIEARDLLVQTYVSPEEGLHYLTQFYTPSRCFDACLQRLAEHEVERGKPQAGYHAASMHVHQLHHAIYHPQRFDEVSVIFVDYEMPGMNGIEFCRQLVNCPAKKVMLTGEADEVLAVEAFNDGVIDQFLRKSDPRCQEKIFEAINYYSWQYFIDRTQTLYNNLTARYAFTCPLEHPAFREIIRRMHNQEGIVEHYLLDAGGSFLMLDEIGRLDWLAVQSDEDMDMFVDLAKDSAASAEVIAALENREKLPFFANPDVLLQVKGPAWDSILHPAQILDGVNTSYFSAWIQDKSFGLVAEDVMGYSMYLKDR